MVPKLSVGIPVYNQAATIEQAIESLLDQQVDPFEIVISDNHSTDGTDRIIAAFGNSIKIVKPPTHLPLIEHWDYCARQMSGDWLAFLAGDDLAYPNYVRVLTSLAASAQEHVVVVTAIGDELDVQTGIKKPYLSLSLNPGVNSGKKMTRLSLFSCKLNVHATAYKSTAFHRAGGFDKRASLCCDYFLEYDLSFYGSFLQSRDIIYAHRTNQCRPTLSQAREVQLIQDRIRFVTLKIPQAAANGVSLSTMIKAAVAHLSPYVFGDKALSPGHPAIHDLQEALATLGKLQIAKASRATKFWKPLFICRRQVIKIIRHYVTALSSRHP